MRPDAGFGVGLQFGCSVPSLRISKSARRRGYAGAIITANASRASQTLPMHRKLCHDRLCGTPGLSPTAAASAPRGKMTLQFLFKALASLLRDLFFLIRSVSWAGAKTWIRSKSISKSCRESAQEVSKLESGRKTRPEAFTQFPSRHFPFPASSFNHRLAERRMRPDLARHALRPGFTRCAGILLWFSSEKKQGAANAVSADLPRPAKVSSAARPAQAEAVRGQSRRIIFTGPRSPDSESFSSEAKPE